MARLAIPLGLGLISSAIGLPFGAGWLVGSVISGLLFSKNQHGPRLTDFEISTSTYGRARPRCWGTNRVAPNIIDALPVVEHSDTDKGKGTSLGGVTTYTYTRTVALGLGYGPQAGILRIWADKKLILDLRSNNTGPSNAGFVWRFYPGDEDQLPDPTLEAHYGVGNQSAYRGEAYLVLVDFPLTPHGNRLPNFEVEVTQGLSGAFPKSAIDEPAAADFVWRFSRDPFSNFIFTVNEDVSSDQHYITKYDAVSGDIIASVEFDMEGSGAGIVSDLYGNVYAIDDTSLFFRLYTFAPATLAPTLLWTSGFGTVFPHLLSIGQSATFGWGPYLFVSEDQGSGQQCFLFRAPAAVGGFLAFPKKVNGTDFTGHNMTMAAWSSDGTMWAVGGTTLRRVTVGADDWTLEADTYDLSAYGTGFDRIVYWLEEDALVVSTSNSGANAVILFDVQSRAVIRTYANSMSSPNAFNSSTFQTPFIVENFLTYTDFQDVYLLDLVTGVETPILEADYGISAGTRSDAVYEPITDSVWTSGASPYRLFLHRGEAGATTVEAILENVANLCSLPSANRDFTNMPDSIWGLKMEEQATGKSVYEVLTTAYFFDVVERGTQLVSVRRGGASVATITESDFAAAERGADFSVLRSQEKEIAREVALSFYDKDHDYLVLTEPAIRSAAAVTSDEKKEIRLPIAMGRDQGVTLAHTMLYVLWAGNRMLRWKSPWSLVRVDTADPVTVVEDSITYQSRVTKTTLGADLSLDFEATTDEAGLYSLDLTGSAESGIPTQQIQYVPGTQFEMIDTAMLRDADDNAGVYVAAQPASPGAAWAGYVLQKSPDAVSFSNALTSVRRGHIGTTLTALPNNDHWTTWDDVSTVDVQLRSDASVVSSTDALVLAGANAFLVGDEIVQAVTVTAIGTDRVRLSRLLRGRKGTESFRTAHAVGDRVVFLSQEMLAALADSVSDIGATNYYRAFSTKQTSIFSAVKPFVNTGRRLKPYAPTYVLGSRDGSNNLTVTWLRRDRHTPTSLWSPVMSEATESYDVDFLDGSTVKRTKTVSSETVSYTAAEQTTDGLTPGNPVHVKIYQRSATVGRGYEKDATI